METSLRPQRSLAFPPLILKQQCHNVLLAQTVRRQLINDRLEESHATSPPLCYRPHVRGRTRVVLMFKFVELIQLRFNNHLGCERNDRKHMGWPTG
jgi:hypothetical protein